MSKSKSHACILTPPPSYHISVSQPVSQQPAEEQVSGSFKSHPQIHLRLKVIPFIDSQLEIQEPDLVSTSLNPLDSAPIPEPLPNSPSLTLSPQELCGAR